jgi:lipopolysaccharide export system permease protein
MKVKLFKRLDTYIIKKFIGTYFFALLIIIGIAVVFDAAEKIDDFMEKNAPLRAIIFDYYMNFIPYFASLFSSLFTFVAVIFFTSKMASNTEIVAILASGVSFKRLLYPYFVAALFIAVLNFLLVGFIIPRANEVKIDFENKYVKKQYQNTETNIHRQLSPNTFVYMENFMVIGKIASKFSLEKFDGNQLKSKLVSDYAVWDSTSGKWTAYNYYIREILNGKEVIKRGEKIDTLIDLSGKELSQRSNVVETMNLVELSRQIVKQKQRGADDVQFLQAERNKRYAYPLSTFILTLIGVSFASRKVRGGIGLHIGMGFVIGFSYLLFMRFSEMFAIGGVISANVAIWVPNILYAFIALYLYWKTPK